MKAYTLTVSKNSRSDLASALAFRLAHGKVGQAIVENGFSKPLWNLTLAKIALAYAKAGKEASDIADAFSSISGENMSAARQAAGDLEFSFGESDADHLAAGGVWVANGKTYIPDAKGKLPEGASKVLPVLLSKYWEKAGKRTASLDTSKLIDC